MTVAFRVGLLRVAPTTTTTASKIQKTTPPFVKIPLPIRSHSNNKQQKYVSYQRIIALTLLIDAWSSNSSAPDSTMDDGDRCDGPPKCCWIVVAGNFGSHPLFSLGFAMNGHCFVIILHLSLYID
jgi:hypothetical protein